MRTLLLLLTASLVACTTAGGKHSDDDDSDDDKGSGFAVDGGTTDVDDPWFDHADDDAWGQPRNEQEFFEQLYEVACDAAIDCNSDPEIIDDYCNTDVAEFSAFEDGPTVSDCDYNADLAEACLDEPVTCDADGWPSFANVCDVVVTCD